MKNKLLLLFIGIIALVTSCKKENDDKALLTSGKWYYQTIKNNRAGGTLSSCRDDTNYIEFRADGTVSLNTLYMSDEHDHATIEGTYSLSADGKTITMDFDNFQWKATVHLLKNDYLRITLLLHYYHERTYEITMSHDKSHCPPAK